MMTQILENSQTLSMAITAEFLYSANSGKVGHEIWHFLHGKFSKYECVHSYEG